MSPRIGADLPTIIQVAAEIADTRGWDEVTLSSVAQSLNIRPPSLYNHIDGLPGLRRLLAIYGLELLHGSLSQALADRNGAEAVRQLANAYVEFSREHPGLYEATLRAPDPQDEEVRSAGAALVNLVLGVLKPLGLEGDEALHAVRGLRSIIHGFSSLERKGAFGMPLHLDRSLQLLVDAYLSGLFVYKEKGS